MREDCFNLYTGNKVLYRKFDIWPKYADNSRHIHAKTHISVPNSWTPFASWVTPMISSVRSVWNKRKYLFRCTANQHWRKVSLSGQNCVVHCEHLQCSLLLMSYFLREKVLGLPMDHPDELFGHTVNSYISSGDRVACYFAYWVRVTFQSTQLYQI